MKNYPKVLLTGVFATTLTACSAINTTSSGEEADAHGRNIAHPYTGEHDYFKSEQPTRLKGTLFDRYLHEGYKGLAKKEDFEHDFDDLEKFQNRAKRAGEGMLVSPEELSVRDLPDWSVAELASARARLESAFYAGASIKMPQAAASAQVNFDCWMEQQEENIQQHDIDECKKNFWTAMNLLEGGPKEPPKGPKHSGPTYTHSHDHEHTHGPGSCVDHTHERPEPVAQMSCPMPDQKAPAYNGPYMIFFELDRANITTEARRILDTVVADSRQMKPRRVIITGHTDTSGNRAHNEALSNRRAQATARMLRSEGVEVSEIRASHYGESKLRVNTRDGVRHAGNRRVEIAFEW